jgi:hypothetical protein
MTKAVLASLLLLSGLLRQAPSVFPREGARQLIDNERVAVWDVTWQKGKPTAMLQSKLDMVTVDLENAEIRIAGAKGKPKSFPFKVGQAGFILKGTSQTEEGTTDPPRHAIAVELKDVVVQPLSYNSAFPDAFPREGAIKLLNNKRVTVWDYTWTKGVPTPMHFHTKDVVVVYLLSGEVRSSAIDGTITINKVEPGQARYNARNRTHTEELLKGASRAIIVELK